jgi:hypothetical protein
MCHVIDTTWRWDGFVNAAGARSVVGDVALCRGGGPSVLVWGGDGGGRHW